MKPKKKNQLESILNVCLGNDPVHGKPHVYRVLKDLNFLKNSKNYIKPLELAIYLHDIGRKNERSLDHGVESIKILKQYFQKETSELLGDKKNIFYAIENHQKYFDIKKDIKKADEKEKLLALLILLDCMDTIGEWGINRVAIAKKIPLIPLESDLKRKWKIKRVKTLLRDYKKRKETYRENMKISSILEHVTYNYAFTSQIRDCVKNILGNNCKILEEIKKRLNVSKKFSENLLKIFNL